MHFRKALSVALAFSMIAGNSVLVAGQPNVEAAPAVEKNTVDGFQDPWKEGQAAKKLESKKDDQVDAAKFTHMEWTGKKYTDLDGTEKNAEDVFGINREEASMFASTSVVYDSVDKAIHGAVDYDKDCSDYVQFLTGEGEGDWILTVLQNQDLAQGEAYKNFYKRDFVESTDDWKHNLMLPCSWPAQGFDFSIYTNTQQPWQSAYDKSVTVPACAVNYNPVGLYRKIFDVDPSMYDADGRIYLSFQGVESSYYVYLNGKEVGYSEDSYSPHSFDVTDYLRDDGNLLAVEVHKFCDGTWMEDQDMFYDGGIFRDVYLYSAPLVHIQDYTVTTDLDDNYENAMLSLSVDVANASTSSVKGYKVDARIYDENGDVFVNGISLDMGEIPAAKDGVDGKATASTSKLVLDPKLWSAEHPNLYTLVLSLYDSETGAYLGSTSQELGFREIEFVPSQVDENGDRITEDFIPIKINGKNLLIKGVNRHDTDPLYGKYIPKETYEEDAKLMKKYNINAVRTSHYSNDEYWYYLCDKYGLYMVAETNLECHALQGASYQAQKALFKELAMDRTETTFERLKNRSAVVIWSTGNECYYSSDASYADGMFYDMIWFFKKNDPTRPVHCEGSNDANGTDMGSNMYPSVASVAKTAASTKMPYVMCEYEHAMGNAIGDFKEYWDLIRSNEYLMGGFIWDWVDQARLLPLTKTGKADAYDYYAENKNHQNLYKDITDGYFYGYGGDSGENPTSVNFCVNGLVSPDRDPQPELEEVKYQYQSIWASASDFDLMNGKITLYNEYNFHNLNEFNVSWDLVEDGKIIASGKMADINLAGRETKTVYFPYLESMPSKKKAGADYFVNINVTLKKDTLWEKAGYVVSHEQFQLPIDVEKAERVINTDVTVNKEDGAIVVSGKDFTFAINEKTGQMENYMYKGEVVLNKGPVPNYWRGLHDNSEMYIMSQSYTYYLEDQNWAKVNRNVTASDIDISKNKYGQYVIKVTLKDATQAALVQTMTYTIDGSGAVSVDAYVDATATKLKRYVRIGTVMELPAGYENVEWYGLGEAESFLDRQDFANYGIYTSTVSDMFYPFLYAQDTGNIENVKWITVTDPEKKSAVAIASETGLEASALHFTADDLFAAKHPYELHPLKETILAINLVSQGIGNEMWGAGILDKYRVQNNKAYSYNYTIVPYTTGADVAEVTAPYRASTANNVIAALIDAINSAIDRADAADKALADAEANVERLDTKVAELENKVVELEAKAEKALADAEEAKKVSAAEAQKTLDAANEALAAAKDAKAAAEKARNEAVEIRNAAAADKTSAEAAKAEALEAQAKAEKALADAEELLKQVQSAQAAAAEAQQKADEAQKKALEAQKAAEAAEAKAKDAEANAEKVKAEAQQKLEEIIKAQEEAQKVLDELNKQIAEASCLKKVTLKSVTAIKKNRIRVSWNRVANACCYKVQYSTNANFKKASSKTVKGKTSIVIKNLKKNKKYYVRVRAIKHNGCVTILGKNSAKKSVKVK